MTTPSLSLRGKIGVLGFLAAGLVAVVLSPSFTTPFGTLTQFFVVVVLLVQSGITTGLLLRPYTRFVGENVRRTDEPEATDYAQLCAEVGTPVEGVWTLDEFRESYGFAAVNGLVPGNRHLFLETTFFDAYAPEERTAVVVREAALARGYYQLFGKTVLYLAFIAYYAVVLVVLYASGASNPFSGWPLVPELLLALLFVGGVRYARRLVYRADRVAAERTDAETVISALKTFAEEKEESDRETVKVKLFSLLWTRPSPKKRIASLREHFDVEESPTRE